jgi:predicted DNA-binding protein
MEPIMKPTASKRPRVAKAERVRVYTRFSLPLRERLHAYSEAKGRSECAVMEEAVARYLANPDKDPSASGPLDRLAQAIDDDRRLQERQHRDLELLSETLGRFLRVWMSVHAPTFNKPATPDAGEELYLGFAAKVADEFRRGHRFVHDLRGFDGTRSPR